MELTQFLDANIINTSLDAKDKNDAIRKMCKLLKEQKYVTDPDEFYEDVLEREKLGETGIGNYVAIPHGKSGLTPFLEARHNAFNMTSSIIK